MNNPPFPTKKKIYNATITSIGMTRTMPGVEGKYPSKRYALVEFVTPENIKGIAKFYFAIERDGEWMAIKGRGSKDSPEILRIGDKITFTSQSRDPGSYSITENQEFKIVGGETPPVEAPPVVTTETDVEKSDVFEVIRYLANKTGVPVGVLKWKKSGIGNTHYIVSDDKPDQIGIQRGIEKKVYESLYTPKHLKDYYDPDMKLEQRTRKLLDAELHGNSPAGSKTVVIKYWRTLLERFLNIDDTIKKVTELALHYGLSSDLPLSWQVSDGEYIGGYSRAGSFTGEIESKCLSELGLTRRGIADTIHITLRMDTLSPFYTVKENVVRYWNFLYDAILQSDKVVPTKAPTPVVVDEKNAWIIKQFTIKDNKMEVIA